MQAYLPVHYDLVESKQLGFQQVEEKPKDQHMHAKVQNSNISSPLYKNISQFHNFEKKNESSYSSMLKETTRKKLKSRYLPVFADSTLMKRVSFLKSKNKKGVFFFYSNEKRKEKSS